MSEYSLMFTCPSCGSSEYTKEGGVLKCRHCGNLYKDSLMSEPIYAKLQYAVNERQEASFDKARRRYEAMLAESKGESPEEVYWGHFLCEQYVIFYQNDIGESIPSFWNINDEPCQSSESYKKALRLGEKSGNAENYQRLAERIEEYKAKYKKVKREFPEGHDIFICFKDSGTTDANLGYKIYNEFSGKYNIFFSRESLNTISGNDYEPYIYHALKTAKVLILLCSDRKNLESKWVHNEWWRFWNFSKGTDKTIIPIFRKGFSASSLPDEIRNCHAHGEDIDLISVLSNRLAAILRNSAEKTVPLTSFEKRLKDAENDWSQGNVDDAKTKVAVLLKESRDRPYDSISTLLLEARILTNNYKNLKNRNARAAIDQASDLADKNDIRLKDMPEYNRYRRALGAERVRIGLLSALSALAVAAIVILSVLMLRDPTVDMYVSGHPDFLEIQYGESPLSAMPDLVTVTKKGKEKTVEVNESMISGYDPTRLGMQALTVTYEGMTVQINVNVVKYRLSAPTGLTVSGGRIVWDAVSRAESYALEINGISYGRVFDGLTSLSVGAEVFEGYGVFSVRVKAVADVDLGVDSDYTEAISVVRFKNASGISSDGLSLSWDPVPGCTQYEVYVNGTQIGTTATASYRVPESEAILGSNICFAVPKDGLNLALAKDVTSQDADNAENHSFALIDVSRYAANIALESGKLVWTAAEGNSPSYKIYVNDTLVDTVWEPSYTPRNEDLVKGANSVYVEVEGGLYFTDDFRVKPTFEFINLYRVSGLRIDIASRTLSWEQVPGCTSYGVYVNGEEVRVVNTASVTLGASLLEYGVNTLYAVPKDAPSLKTEDQLTPSELESLGADSKAVCYLYENIPSLTFNEGTVSWQSSGADVYRVSVNGSTLASVGECFYTLGGSALREGDNEILVTPSSGYLTDTPVDEAPYTGNGKLTLMKLAKVTGIGVKGSVLSWNSVPGASEYEIFKNGSSVGKTADTSYIIPTGTGESCTYTVKALGFGTTVDSDISSELVSLKYLTAPTSLGLDSFILSWQAVEGALGYEIFANGNSVASTGAEELSINLLGRLPKGSYTLYVVAKGDGNTVFSSAPSATVPFEVTETVTYITSEDDLKKMALDQDGIYVLGADITLTSPWTPVGTTAKPFTGRFNGGDFTIKGLVLSPVSGQGTGLFGVVGEGAIIENLKLEAVSVSDSEYNCIGALAGINYGTVRRVEVSGAVRSSGNYIGGIIGRNYGSVYECTNRATVVGARNVGGIVGKIECPSSDILIHTLTNLSSVSGEYRVGGIAGDVTVTKKNTIFGLTNKGDVTSRSSYAAGCFGYVSGSAGQMVTLYSCQNSGNVTAADYAAGCFVKGTYVTVTVDNIAEPEKNCINTGKVTATSGSNRNDI